ncbi:STAS domain-containing protein [Nocardia sp. NPDC056611]|uniref:STAS domain-containing protein n=1 Tax=Nocardia sp. NPDC056611 TaxID=3345877 RepID=UPI00366E5E43
MPTSFIVAGGPAIVERRGQHSLLGVTHSAPSPTTTVVTATGEIDYYNVGDFREHLGYAISTSTRLVVVDLSRLTFLSISGLQAILDADDHARSRRRVLRVVTGTRCVDRLLEVCCQDAELEIARTIAAACTRWPG